MPCRVAVNENCVPECESLFRPKAYIDEFALDGSRLFLHFVGKRKTRNCVFHLQAKGVWTLSLRVVASLSV